MDNQWQIDDIDRFKTATSISYRSYFYNINIHMLHNHLSISIIDKRKLILAFSYYRACKPWALKDLHRLLLYVEDYATASFIYSYIFFFELVDCGRRNLKLLSQAITWFFRVTEVHFFVINALILIIGVIRDTKCAYNNKINNSFCTNKINNNFYNNINNSENKINYSL